MVDKRYLIPKEEHGIPEELIDQAIEDNDIYREVRQHILNMQKRQVGYGMKKYPQTLNKDSWTVVETIDHIIEESVDKLHYLVMLRQKLIDQVEVSYYDDEGINWAANLLGGINDEQKETKE